MIPQHHVPEKTVSDMFISKQNALNYMRENDLIPLNTPCDFCNGVMSFEKDVASSNGAYYRCSSLSCRRKKSLFKNTTFDSPEVPLHKKLLAYYEVLADDYQKRIINDCSLSKSSVQKIKKNFLKYCVFKNTNNKKILMGVKNSIQIDETVIYKGKLILSPSNIYDNLPGCTWLVGLIEQHTSNMVIEIVPNRQVATLKELILKHCKIGSLIITDGYPSYPRAVLESFCYHEKVNHTIGFKNEHGYHTNNIENIWSQLKYYEKKRLGILGIYVSTFLEEFRFRYYYLKQGNYKDVGYYWYEMLKYLIKN